MALGRTVQELLTSITSQELVYWLAYYRLEPFGDERADLRCAITSCTVANAFRAKGRPYKVSEFMPSFTQPKPFPPELLFAYFAGLKERQERKRI